MDIKEAENLLGACGISLVRSLLADTRRLSLIKTFIASSLSLIEHQITDAGLVIANLDVLANTSGRLLSFFREEVSRAAAPLNNIKAILEPWADCPPLRGLMTGIQDKEKEIIDNVKNFFVSMTGGKAETLGDLDNLAYEEQAIHRKLRHHTAKLEDLKLRKKTLTAIQVYIESLEGEE